MKLYNYWRSGTSYRVRIALELKDLAYEYVALDLREAAHKSSAYTQLNPQALVPSLLLDDGTAITQSPAIIEYLEEAWPEAPLLPSDPVTKARVRAMAAVIGCDIHPLNNLRILKYLKTDLSQPQEEIDKWISRWIVDGFTALEDLLRQDEKRTGFASGDAPGLVECYLLPQIYSARRFNVDMDQFELLTDIESKCLKLDAFTKAYPDNQPDAD